MYPSLFSHQTIYCAFSHVHDRWFVFDTETKDLVTVHTDGNEQLSVMRYSPGESGKLLPIQSQQLRNPAWMSSREEVSQAS